MVLYDLTTLYFEAEHEDALRKVGMSKERRVDPQITVGLLVARNGFPLDLHVFEGNKAETKTSIPVITGFIERHRITDMIVVADAGMLSGEPQRPRGCRPEVHRRLTHIEGTERARGAFR